MLGECWAHIHACSFVSPAQSTNEVVLRVSSVVCPCFRARQRARHAVCAARVSLQTRMMVDSYAAHDTAASSLTAAVCPVRASQEQKYDRGDGINDTQSSTDVKTTNDIDYKVARS